MSVLVTLAVYGSGSLHRSRPGGGNPSSAARDPSERPGPRTDK